MKLYQQIILIVGAIFALILSLVLNIKIIPLFVVVGVAIALVVFLLKDKLKSLKNRQVEPITEKDMENLRLNILDLKYEFYESKEISCPSEKSKELLEVILDTKFDKKSMEFFYQLTKKARQSYNDK